MCSHSWEPLITDRHSDLIKWVYCSIVYLHKLLPGKFPLSTILFFFFFKSYFYKKQDSSSWKESIHFLGEKIYSPSVYVNSFTWAGQALYWAWTARRGLRPGPCKSAGCSVVGEDTHVGNIKIYLRRIEGSVGYCCMQTCFCLWYVISSVRWCTFEGWDYANTRFYVWGKLRMFMGEEKTELKGTLT